MAEELLVKLGVKDAGASLQVRELKKEIRALDGEFKALKTSSGNYEKSLPGLNTKLELLNRKLEANQKLLEAEQRRFKENSGTLAERKRRLEELKKSEGDHATEIARTEKQIQTLTSQCNASEREIKRLGTTIDSTNAEIKETSEAIKAVPLEEYKAKVQAATDKMKSMGDRLQAVGSKMEDVGRKATVVSAGLVAIGGAGVKEVIKLESAWTGVTKTVDGTSAQMETLKKKLVELSNTKLPTTAADLMKIGEIAGQLGIKAPNIAGFTETIQRLADSTNLGAEEGSSQMARFANILGMSQKDFSKLGSTLVDLGNNFATTEAEIMEMGLRLAGAGKQVGMSESEILGFAASLSSVGIEAEMGGSAFSKLMINMKLATADGGKKLEQFANVAGMTAGEFKTAFEHNAAGALDKFFQGLGNINKNGGDVISTLNDMGIKEVRLRDTILRAAGASDLFTESLAMGRNAWRENTALTKESSKRYETLESRIKLAKNQLVDVGRQIGEILIPYVEKGLKKVQEFVKWFNSLDQATKDNIVRIGAMAAAFGPLLVAGGKVTKGVGGIVKVVATLGEKLALSKAGTAALGGAMSAAGGTTGAGALATGLGAALPVIGAVGAAVGVVAAGVVAYNKYQKAMNSTVLDTNEDLGVLEKAFLALNGQQAYSRQELEKMGLVYKDFSGNISDEFKKKVEESTAEVHKLSMELAGINADGVVTKEEADAFGDGIKAMVQKGINAMNEKKEEAIKTQKELMMSDGVISESEQDVLDYLTKNHDTNITETNKLKDEIETILKKAAEAKRKLNNQEVEDVKAKLQTIKQLEIESMAKNGDELAFARNEFTERMKKLDLQGASDLLAEKAKQRDEELIETKAFYNAGIEELQKNLSTASKSEKAALLAQIAEYETTRDKKLKTINGEWDSYLGILEEKYPEIYEKINKGNGEILKRGEEASSKNLDNFTKMYAGLGGITESGWYKIKNSTTGAMDKMYVSVDETTGKINGVYDEATKKIGADSDVIRKKLEDVSGTAGTEAQKFATSVLDMKAKMDATGQGVENVAGLIKDKMGEVTTKADGTKSAFISLNGTKLEVKMDAQGAITNLSSIISQLNEIKNNKYQTVTVDTFHRRYDLQGHYNDAAYARIMGYMAGTMSAPAGVANVNETGWELFDSPSGRPAYYAGRAAQGDYAYLERGTKVTNHLASTAAMIDAIKKEVSRQLAKIDFGNPYYNRKSIQSIALKDYAVGGSAPARNEMKGFMDNIIEAIKAGFGNANLNVSVNAASGQTIDIEREMSRLWRGRR